MKSLILSLVAVLGLVASADAHGGLAFRQRVVVRQPVVRQRVVVQRQAFVGHHAQAFVQQQFVQPHVQQFVAPQVYVAPQQFVVPQAYGVQQFNGGCAACFR